TSATFTVPSPLTSPSSSLGSTGTPLGVMDRLSKAKPWPLVLPPTPAYSHRTYTRLPGLTVRPVIVALWGKDWAGEMMLLLVPSVGKLTEASGTRVQSMPLVL